MRVINNHSSGCGSGAKVRDWPESSDCPWQMGR